MTQQSTMVNKNMLLLRKFHHLSQKAVSDEIHLSRSTYSTYETGVKTPDLQTLDALSSLYTIGFDCLVNQDISKGVLHQVFFEDQDAAMINLLARYQNLSIASKNLVMEHMNILLDRESLYYRDEDWVKEWKEKGKQEPRE